MSVENIDGKPAIRVKGKVLYEAKNGKACNIDFEGQREWIPVSQFREDKPNEAIEITEWLAKKIFNPEKTQLATPHK